MKINTKRATPIKGSPSCFVSENRYVQVDNYPNLAEQSETTTTIKDDENDNDDDELGRQITYVATGVFTPVKTSKRISDGKKDASPASDRERRYTRDEVEELLSAFQSVSISDKKKKKDEEEEKVSDEVPQKNDAEIEESRGRASKVIRLSNGSAVRVTRSLRLAKDAE